MLVYLVCVLLFRGSFWVVGWISAEGINDSWKAVLGHSQGSWGKSRQWEHRQRVLVVCLIRTRESNQGSWVSNITSTSYIISYIYIYHIYIYHIYIYHIYIYHPPIDALVTSHIKFQQSPVFPLPPMAVATDAITKVVTLGSHKKGGTAGSIVGWG